MRKNINNFFVFAMYDNVVNDFSAISPHIEMSITHSTTHSRLPVYHLLPSLDIKTFLD